VNDGFEEEVEQQFNVYTTGAPLAIDDQLDEAMRGAVNVEYIN